ncbi:hypothetical protein UCREL1_11736 [Eutypa lata UCREL1]|uniref:DUF7726 domain-containing protein n=1 Tax=Eutypa lata (strain UCR-EL1) TaxID=1287681 RepID=M7SB02_EUTLA|nr:hypothetical protein UCREL1_11736 [Eutypa lata UCREL1]
MGEMGFHPQAQYQPGQLLQPMQQMQHMQAMQPMQPLHHYPQPPPPPPPPGPVAPVSAPGSTSSRKRKSDAMEEPEEFLQQPDHIPDISDDDPRLYHVDQSCQQIRRKIRDFIDGGNMKVKEFQEAIGVSARSYQNFMSMTGTDKGMNCDTYPAAFKFFKKRELQGLRALPPKKAKTGPRKNIAEEKASKTFDTGGLRLDGEDRQAVPVYDTCDEVRKKIRAFLKKPDVTQAAFCRAIGDSFPEKRSIQSRQLSTFLGRKGPTAGNTSAVFYGSYVFFEKMRMKEGKGKSQFRLEMESIHPKGMNVTDQIDGGWVTMHKDERMVQDKYGRIDFVRVR